MPSLRALLREAAHLGETAEVTSRLDGRR
jgi:hypothetical protein